MTKTLLSTAIAEYDDDIKLLCYLQEEVENKGRQEELMEMIKWDHPDKTGIKIKCTYLQLALRYQKSRKKVIFKIMDMGGRELVMKKGQNGDTALHCACKDKNVPTEVISKMLEMGGRELLMMNDEDGTSALHYACRNDNVSREIISMLLEMGGRELLII